MQKIYEIAVDMMTTQGAIDKYEIWDTEIIFPNILEEHKRYVHVWSHTLFGSLMANTNKFRYTVGYTVVFLYVIGIGATTWFIRQMMGEHPEYARFAQREITLLLL